jgi:outer membrane protein assembly factor BamA
LFLLLLILPLLAGTTACTVMVPRKDLPPPVISDEFPEKVKTVILPLPVIATDPNEGPTVGALTAFLLHDKKDEVRTLIAPQVNYNKNFGITGTLYASFFPLEGREWELNFSKSENVNEDYGVRFLDRRILGGKTELDAYLRYFTNGAARFYGLGPRSPKSGTNFGDNEVFWNASIGYDLTKDLHVLVGERFRRFSMRPGAVASLPFTMDVFSAGQVPGLGGFTVNAQRVSLIYSSLSPLKMPLGGFLARALLEFSGRALGSGTSFVHYLAEAKGYIQEGSDRYVTVARAAFNHVNGANIPFLEKSILGGEESLRGFGEFRFIDNTALLFNVEERIRLLRATLFNVNADWELAPFVDAGTVSPSPQRLALKNFLVCPGFGMRGVVRPNIVGHMDVGFGREGPAVFVGLDYPF